MSRYFFHLLARAGVVDEEGIELPDLQTAKTTARRYAISMAATEILESQRLDLGQAIKVSDETGRALYTVHFGDVIQIIS